MFNTKRRRMQLLLVKCLMDVGMMVDNSLSSFLLYTNGQLLYVVYMIAVYVHVASHVISFMFSRILVMHTQFNCEMIGTLREDSLVLTRPILILGEGAIFQASGDVDVPDTNTTRAGLQTGSTTIVCSVIGVSGHVPAHVPAHRLDQGLTLVHVTGSREELDPGRHHPHRHQPQAPGPGPGLAPEDALDTDKNPNPRRMFGGPIQAPNLDQKVNLETRKLQPSIKTKLHTRDRLVMIQLAV